jgi:hypothetical protein
MMMRNDIHDLELAFQLHSSLTLCSSGLLHVQISVVSETIMIASFVPTRTPDCAVKSPPQMKNQA